MQSKYLEVIIPFIIALTIEFFSKELINGGLSQQTFFLINRALYLVAIGSLVYFVIKDKVCAAEERLN